MHAHDCLMPARFVALARLGRRSPFQRPLRRVQEAWPTCWFLPCWLLPHALAHALGAKSHRRDHLTAWLWGGWCRSPRIPPCRPPLALRRGWNPCEPKGYGTAVGSHTSALPAPPQAWASGGSLGVAFARRRVTSTALSNNSSRRLVAGRVLPRDPRAALRGGALFPGSECCHDVQRGPLRMAPSAPAEASWSWPLLASTWPPSTPNGVPSVAETVPARFEDDQRARGDVPGFDLVLPVARRSDRTRHNTGRAPRCRRAAPPALPGSALRSCAARAGTAARSYGNPVASSA